jgi:aspartyl-tRNA synthetase
MHAQSNLCDVCYTNCLTLNSQEMGITEHYDEVLHILHGVFKHIFTGLEERCPELLTTIRKQYASEPVQFTDEPCIIHWQDAISYLREAGLEVCVTI